VIHSHLNGVVYSIFSIAFWQSALIRKFAVAPLRCSEQWRRSVVK